jgi:hypothetical protein
VAWLKESFTTAITRPHKPRRMQLIDTSKRGTTSLSGARSAPDERSGGMSGYRASSPKQTTAKIRCIADSGSAKVIDVTNHLANCRKLLLAFNGLRLKPSLNSSSRKCHRRRRVCGIETVVWKPECNANVIPPSWIGFCSNWEFVGPASPRTYWPGTEPQHALGLASAKVPGIQPGRNAGRE